MRPIDSIQEQFPIFSSMRSEQKEWVYLDSAATTQKPQVVLQAIMEGYTRYNANVHRGVYKMSRETTERHEQARKRMGKFIGATSPREVLFTRGTTDAINLIAASYGDMVLKPGDEILISAMEHHANIVPWQMACKRTGARLIVAPITPEGALDLDQFKERLSPRTRIVSMAHVSNVLGTQNPIAEVAKMAHSVGAAMIVDGAQAVAHLPVNVQELGADFYVFSSHKLYGPTGIGILWGKEQLLQDMPPYQTGGEMINTVTFAHTTFNELPYKFEAGTPDFIGSHALSVAADFLESIGWEDIMTHEQELLLHATEIVSRLPDVSILGTAPNKLGVVSMVSPKAHAYDLGMLLDQQGIALRTGHHCAQPLIESLGYNATLRLSLGVYNTHQDLESFEQAMQKALSFF